MRSYRSRTPSESNGKVLVYRKVVSGENIRNAGEDIATGQTVIHKGDRLNPAAIGLLASLNRSAVPVYRRPSVAIISTGDEILDVGEPGPPGRIRNSNAYTLMSEVKKYGASPHYIGIARDTIEDTRARFTEAFKHDIVISTGGVSMGKYDHVAEVMKGLGIEILIETIRMKPASRVFSGPGAASFFSGFG
jgi:molybdopterin molybdotransferase